MSVLLCLAVYYEGIIGPVTVNCTKLSPIERVEAAAWCAKSPYCRSTWVQDAMWVNVYLGPKPTTEKTVKL